MAELLASSSFLWVPGQGPDAAALERIANAFPKPRKPMGEAWFMAPQRQMYPELLGDLEALSDEQLDRSMEQIAMGPSSFGQLQEWTEWYHYLLPRWLQRSWRPVLHHPVEVLITGFMAQHPDHAGDWPYPSFRTDALATLGQYIMSAPFWPDSDGVPRCFNKWRGPNGICGWYRADGLLSASLFLCLKYLPADRVRLWFESVAANPNKYWQAQLLTWLVGAHPILTGEIDQPAQFPEEGPFGISWEWSHTLSGNYSGNFEAPILLVPFLPLENKAAILDVAREMDADNFFEELLTNPELEEVATETTGLPELFGQLYKSAPIA